MTKWKWYKSKVVNPHGEKVPCHILKDSYGFIRGYIRATVRDEQFKAGNNFYCYMFDYSDSSENENGSFYESTLKRAKMVLQRCAAHQIGRWGKIRIQLITGLASGSFGNQPINDIFGRADLMLHEMFEERGIKPMSLRELLKDD